ncbi:MAG: type III pantothenate kinase [Flammeovirgaceae bacterium]|nr:type III pantothenate kinase [Flammeovirgaceae bacterium]
MLLAIDIGNSDITLGISASEQWSHVWRIPSVIEKPELFYGIRIREYFFEAGIPTNSINTIVISSVVPDLTDKVINVAKALFEKKIIVLGPEIYRQLPLEVLNPFEIGSDIVSNAMAANIKYPNQNCIVVDFGTALTFTTIASIGKIEGVAIAPGLKTAIRALSQNTAKLFDVPLQMPESALGKNTVHAIQAGILFGYEGMVKSVLSRIKAELNDQQTVTIATGGLSSIITSLKDTFTAVEPNLTLDGLRIIGSQVEG